MNREEALKLQQQGKAVYYTGRARHLRGRKLYIKHVYAKIAVVTSTPLLNRPEDDSYHDVKLEHLTAPEHWAN